MKKITRTVVIRNLASTTDWVLGFLAPILSIVLLGVGCKVWTSPEEALISDVIAFGSLMLLSLVFALYSIIFWVAFSNLALCTKHFKVRKNSLILKDAMTNKVFFEGCSFEIDNAVFAKLEQFKTYYVVEILDHVQFYDTDEWMWEKNL